jgi:SAM-dependent methyltransferase
MSLQSSARMLGLCGLIVLALWLVPRVAFHALPPGMTGESRRLAAALKIEAGSVVADIGAGEGRLARSIAPIVGPASSLYVTELDAALFSELREHSPANVVVIRATAEDIGLPAGCCDAIYMRNVYHHIANPRSFNTQLRGALRPAGRVAVIDFAPGTFSHLRGTESDAANGRHGHGVALADVVRELSDAGFAIEHIDPSWGGWMYLVLARVRDSETNP